MSSSVIDAPMPVTSPFPEVVNAAAGGIPSSRTAVASAVVVLLAIVERSTSDICQRVKLERKIVRQWFTKLRAVKDVIEQTNWRRKRIFLRGTHVIVVVSQIRIAR
jgi:hypothetical protein